MFCAEREWTGLYSQSHDLWVSEAMSHPAKGSPALFFKIIEHLEELGLLKPDSVILDFMAGIGTTCIAAGMKGFRSISVELESKFCDLQCQNKAYVERKTHRKLDWTILQGDARELSKILSEHELIGITSPPYTDIGHKAGDRASEEYKDRLDMQRRYTESMESEGNISNLPDKVIGVVSPPYEDSKVRNVEEAIGKGWKEKGRTAHDNIAGYGQGEGQIGRTGEQENVGETYLSAMAQVYSECAKVCSVLVVVVKDPTRNGKLRLLGRDTCRILRRSGWHIFDYHRAVLFTEHSQTDLFGETKKKVKGRLSFFKRLSWQKGSPVAAYEHVIFAQSLYDAPLIAVVSPPYGDLAHSPGEGERQQKLVREKSLLGNATEYSDNPANIGNLNDR